MHIHTLICVTGFKITIAQQRELINICMNIYCKINGLCSSFEPMCVHIFIDLQMLWNEMRYSCVWM